MSGFLTGAGFTLKWYLSTENYNNLLRELKISNEEKIRINIYGVDVEFEINNDIIGEMEKEASNISSKIAKIRNDL